jgi:hypothetical protein
MVNYLICAFISNSWRLSCNVYFCERHELNVMYPLYPGAFSPLLNRSRLEAVCSALAHAEVKSVGALSPLPHTSSWFGACVVYVIQWVSFKFMYFFWKNQYICVLEFQIWVCTRYIVTSLTFPGSSSEITTAGAVGKYRNMCYFHYVFSKWCIFLFNYPQFYKGLW